MNNFIQNIKNYYAQKPLQSILFVALVFRLIAALFAKGYGMHDDHFLIIESSGSFSDGYDYNNWLPTSPGNQGPQGHSFFYMGLHYFLFVILNAIGITSPDVKMYVVRIIHAVYSLAIVYFGYRIAFKYAGQKIASQVGWLLALLWFMPWLSVRNLVEFQCIPFLLWGLWIYIKKDNPTIKAIILSGLISGLAFSIRFQSIFFLVGFGLALLFTKQFRNAIVWGITTVFMMLFVQGMIDFFVWGKPFMELQEYIRYNIEAANDYLKGGFFKYFGVIAGILIPPVSIFLFWGFFARWRKYLLLFLPSFIFLLFHSLFVNKQERFIFTIIPSIIILGVIGWNEFMAKRNHIKWLRSFIKGSWIFAIVINTILLSVVTVHYSKKARVETILYLSQYDNVECVVTTTDTPILPMFYMGEWIPRSFVDINKMPTDIAKLKNEPRFIIATKKEVEQGIIDSLITYYPELTFETEIIPNFVDHLLHTINPRNRNEILVIYRNQKYFPESIVKR